MLNKISDKTEEQLLHNAPHLELYLQYAQNLAPGFMRNLKQLYPFVQYRMTVHLQSTKFKILE